MTRADQDRDERQTTAPLRRQRAPKETHGSAAACKDAEILLDTMTQPQDQKLQRAGIEPWAWADA
jgi:hypothetical protein